MPDAPEYEYYQPFLDARDRLKKALLGSNLSEIVTRLLTFEKAEVELRTEVRQLHSRKLLSADENVRLAGLANDCLPLAAEAKSRCAKEGFKVYG